ncbi:hypothetical protein [Streptomyces hundungensis]|uniref:hypothetical protein n=1 Tax=Streptomyces hundungensis TaxID=1077946 RepID=UPI0013C459C9|nr:hypothetical protein [Streptomyces hundungensis]
MKSRPVSNGTSGNVVLTLIGWAAWAAFTGSVLLETVALLRGRSLQRGQYP